MKDVIKSEDVISKKRERFIRIVESRVNKILETLEILGNCSNLRNYEYSEEDIKKIFTEIEKKVKETKSMFHETSTKKNRFKI